MDFTQDTTGTNQQDSIRIQSSARRRVLCALASACLPGVGQWFLGKKRAAVGFIIACLTIASMYWPFRLPRFYAALACLLIGSLAMYVFATWNALRTSGDLAAKGSLWWLTLLVPVAILAASAQSNWMLIAAGFRVFNLPSESMELTISKDDRIIVDLWRYRRSKPVPTQIVIFPHAHGFWLKRLIVAEGHTISGRDGDIFVDGIRLDEPYVRHVGHPPRSMNNFDPIQIPQGKLFVMGDNRDESIDSRMPDFGLVDADRIAGQALYIARSKDWSRNGTDLR
jgi:signal peptidase I